MRKILWDRYKLEVESGTPIRYYLDFKNDDRLLELKETLERIDRGNFGTCLVCGEPIDVQLLTTSPATQFCATCMGGGQASRSSTPERDEITQSRPPR